MRMLLPFSNPASSLKFNDTQGTAIGAELGDAICENGIIVKVHVPRQNGLDERLFGNVIHNLQRDGVRALIRTDMGIGIAFPLSRNGSPPKQAQLTEL